MSPKYFAKYLVLRPDEEIKAALHSHVIANFKQILVTVFLILLAFFLMFYLFSLGALGVAFFLAILLTGIFYGLREFYLWFMNVAIVTTQRIIDIEQRGFFHRTVSVADYDKITDICYSVEGFSQTILKLGTIKINASSVKLVIKSIGNVVNVNHLLVDLVRDFTGKNIPVKKVQSSSEEKAAESKVKEQATENFLNETDLSEYDEYDLNDLVSEYTEVFSELRLKKYLVDQLEDYDVKHPDEAREAAAEIEETIAEEDEEDVEEAAEDEAELEVESADDEESEDEEAEAVAEEADNDDEVVEIYEIDEDDEDEEEPEIKAVKFKKKKL